MSSFAEEQFGPTPSLSEVARLLESAGIDTAAFRQTLTQANASLPQEVTGLAQPVSAITPAAIAAATRGCFLPSDLASGGSEPSQDIASLLSQSDVMSTGSQRAWQLRPEVRRSILVQAQGAGMLGEIAQSVSLQDPRDGEGPLLRQVLAGSPPNLDAMSLEELEQLATVSQWLSGTQLASLPSPEELRRLIGQREILDPFRTLVGRTVEAAGDGSNDRVVGRTKQIERLRAYVGVREPEELKFYVGRALNSLWSTVSRSNNANEPLLIQGSGGMGKSTLIAKFVLDHALFPGVDLPFIYLDFDRAALAPRQPLQLLIEIARQLGLRFPVVEPQLKDLRASLRDSIDSQARNANRSQRESVTGSELNSFCASLRSVVESFNKESSPVVMLFDTFEVVQYDEEAVNGVNALISALRQPDAFAWSGLRIVVAGRGSLSDIATSLDPVELPPLSLLATTQLLQRRSASEGLGLTKPQIAALARAVRNSPLDVIIVTNWLGDREPADRARLVEDLVREVGSNTAPEGADAGERGSELLSLRVTGILVNRMIDHINDKDVRTLAVPGLVVRAITPDIIRDVMAPASGLSGPGNPLPAGSEAELWKRLERERWLVTRHGEVLRHRPEVRLSMLALMRYQGRQGFDRANELAITTFSAQAARDDVARAEATYHLLLGEKPLDLVEALWTPSAGRLLANAVDDLAPRAQGYLKAKLGRSVPIETLKSLSNFILAPLLNSFGRRYLQRLGPMGVLEVLDSTGPLQNDKSLAGLRNEALYRAGRWDQLTGGPDTSAGPTWLNDASAFLWNGELQRRSSPDESVLTALRFLLRAATRDASVDSNWARLTGRPATVEADLAQLLENPALCWDFATFIACRASGTGFGANQRDAVLSGAARLSRTQKRLPDAAAGSDAMRILAFFESGPDRTFLRRVDFENHFATVSGPEIRALTELMESRLDNIEELTKSATQPRQLESVRRRGIALVEELRHFAKDVVVADVRITREFAWAVRNASEGGGERTARAVLRLLSFKHPDWLQPLGTALAQAFDGAVPRKIGWWSSVDKYLGSGGQAKKEKPNLDGQEILALADEAGSLAEAVAAYERLMGGSSNAVHPERFLSLAKAFREWVSLLGQAVDGSTTQPRPKASS